VLGFVRKIEGGIYIDWDCNKVQKLEKGIFLPTGASNPKAQEKFDAALNRFLKKWYAASEGVTIY
jgi:hypothetical protein